MQGLDCSFTYVDDLIDSQDHQEHEQHLRQIFKHLQESGISINSAKCTFGVSRNKFLGHEIIPENVKPLKNRIQAILNYSRPKTMIQLRRFLSMLNYYRRHLKHAATTQASLNELLKDSRKNDKRPIPWTTTSNNAFQQCKKELAQATLLAYFRENVPLILHTDASDTVVGASLQQECGQ